MNKIVITLGLAALLCGASSIVVPSMNEASAAPAEKAAQAVKAAKPVQTAVYVLSDGTEAIVTTFDDGTVKVDLSNGTSFSDAEAQSFLAENGIKLVIAEDGTITQVAVAPGVKVKAAPAAAPAAAASSVALPANVAAGSAASDRAYSSAMSLGGGSSSGGTIGKPVSK